MKLELIAQATFSPEDDLDVLLTVSVFFAAGLSPEPLPLPLLLPEDDSLDEDEDAESAETFSLVSLVAGSVAVAPFLLSVR
jgi:hypothetical protein